MFKNLFESTRKKRIWQNLATLVVFGIGVYLILPQITTFAISWQVLINMLLWAVGLAFLAQGLSYLGSGYLLQKTFAITQQVVSIFRSTLMVLGAASVALVAGGYVGSSAAIFGWTSGEKGSVGGSTLASFLPSLFNTMMLIVISIFGLVYLILVNGLTQIQLIGFSILLVSMGLVIGASILASHHRQYASSAALWFASHLALLRHKPFDPAPTQKEVDNLFLAWDELWGGEWHLLTLGAFLNVLFDMLTLYFLFIASGNNIGFDVLVVGYALPLLLGKIAFILPGGVGVVETSMAALYNGMGIPKTSTVVVVLAYRFISFWIPSLIGFPVAAYLQRSHIRSQKKVMHDSKRMGIIDSNH